MDKIDIYDMNVYISSLCVSSEFMKEAQGDHLYRSQAPSSSSCRSCFSMIFRVGNEAISMGTEDNEVEIEDSCGS